MHPTKTIHRLVSRIARFAYVSLALLCAASAVHAATVSVYERSGGGFGSTPTNSPNNNAMTDPFIDSGLDVKVGDLVTITATGKLCLVIAQSGCSTAEVGPNGTTLSGPDINPSGYWTVLGDIFGALVGAIVDDSSPLFAPGDQADMPPGDLGINASDVFFVGESLTFTATKAGSLYFGVSDSMFWDNGSSTQGFTVTATAQSSSVPEPGSLALLGLGVALLSAKRRHSR